MIYFHVLITIRAVRFETFVIFSRHAHVTHGAISQLFADGLAFQLVCLMFFVTRATSKVSIARLARDFLQSKYTEELTCSRYTSLHTSASRHVRILYYSLCIHTDASSHPKTVYHMVMSPYVVIHLVNSFLGFYLAVEHYVFAIQSSENDDPVLFEMFLKSH